MEKFTTLESTVVPLPTSNIDTDQIIPARFLKSTSREGFGDNLFCDWRNSGGRDFILNDSNYQGQVLVTGANFGCGSSREHAAWALYDYGFRVVISSSFADIFKANALNNGMLPVELNNSVVELILDASSSNWSLECKVDLETQTVECPQLKIQEQFEIDPYKKKCLLNGFDDIDFLIDMQPMIRQFEATLQ